jgi:hypothetical protein
MPDIPHLSASQVKTAHLCMRKWWFEKQAKVTPGAKYHFHIGKVLHAYLERFQLRQPQEPVDWGVGLQPGHAEWIRKRLDLALEKGIIRTVPRTTHIEYQLSALIGRDLVDHRGMPLLGRARATTSATGDRLALPPTHFHDPHGIFHTDLPIPADAFKLGYFTGFMDGLDLDPITPGVFDHKTAKSKKYAKNAKTLAQDDQMLAYAAVLFALMPSVAYAYLQHNIFLKDEEVPDDKAVYSVRSGVQVAAVAESWKHIITTAERMVPMRLIPVGIGPQRANAFDQVPCAIQEHGLQRAKRIACEAFGGCPYKPICHGYKRVDTVVRDLDDEKARVDQYGNDPKKLDERIHGIPAPKTFKLNVKKVVDTTSTAATPTVPTLPKPEPRMPFLKKTAPALNIPLTLGSYVYVNDPEVATVAYRGIIKVERMTNEVDVFLFEDPMGVRPVMQPEVEANPDRMVTVPRTEVSVALPAGRTASPFLTEAPAAAETTPKADPAPIPDSPIPPAGNVQLNTPSADAILAQAKDAGTPAAGQPPATTAAAAAKRPGRPAKAKSDAQILPEGAKQETLTDPAPATGKVRKDARLLIRTAEGITDILVTEISPSGNYARVQDCTRERVEWSVIASLNILEVLA